MLNHDFICAHTVHYLLVNTRVGHKHELQSKQDSGQALSQKATAEPQAVPMLQSRTTSVRAALVTDQFRMGSTADAHIGTL